jgi:hypothetical protein
MWAVSIGEICKTVNGKYQHHGEREDANSNSNNVVNLENELLIWFRKKQKRAIKANHFK